MLCTYERMSVCVQLLCAKHLLHFSIENVFKQLDHPMVGMWLAVLKAEKHGLVEKP